MKTMKHTAVALAVLGAIGLSGCGSSGSSSSATQQVTGVITGFGSVFVNGVEFETTNTSIRLDDDSNGSESGLAIGMLVTVEGTVNDDGISGDAVSISFADDVEGPILSTTFASDGTGTINVLGQNVTITADTKFESNIGSVTALSQLATGNVVEVSGYASGDGQIFATYVELKSLAYVAGTEIEVKGSVSSLNTTAKTFSLGSLVVDYSNAELDDMPSGGLADGLYVEAKSTQGLDSSNRLIASKVEVEGDGEAGLDAEDGDEVELEGVVTSVTSATEFKVNAQTVRITATTEFEHGTADLITLNAHVEVEGTMDANGVLIADKVEFEDENGDDIDD